MTRTCTRLKQHVKHQGLAMWTLTHSYWYVLDTSVIPPLTLAPSLLNLSMAHKISVRDFYHNYSMSHNACHSLKREVTTCILIDFPCQSLPPLIEHSSFTIQLRSLRILVTKWLPQHRIWIGPEMASIGLLPAISKSRNQSVFRWSLCLYSNVVVRYNTIQFTKELGPRV